MVLAVPARPLAHRQLVLDDPGEVPGLDALGPLSLDCHGPILPDAEGFRSQTRQIWGPRNPRRDSAGGFAVPPAERPPSLAVVQPQSRRRFPGLTVAGGAAALAFSETYTGDRVAALMFGLLTMVDAAFEHKEDFYILDSLDERKLFNSARNMDVAVWKLGHDRMSTGEAYLLSNELDPGNRNLSFEREFGRVMGLLDFMARIVADRNGRGFSRLTHSVVSTIFLPVGFLK